MPSESNEYEVKLYPRGPNSCEWKLWPTAGGPPVANGVGKNAIDAGNAGRKAKERLEAKKA